MVVESSNSVGNRSSLYTFDIRRRCKYFCLHMFVLMVLALTVIVGYMYLNCRLVTTTSRCELPLVAERTPLPICRGHSFARALTKTTCTGRIERYKLPTRLLYRTFAPLQRATCDNPSEAENANPSSSARDLFCSTALLLPS